MSGDIAASTRRRLALAEQIADFLGDITEPSDRSALILAMIDVLCEVIADTGEDIADVEFQRRCELTERVLHNALWPINTL